MKNNSLLLKKLIFEVIQQTLIEDKRGTLKKMGLPPNIIDYLHNFYPPLSYKYSDWMVKAIMDYGGGAAQALKTFISVYDKNNPESEQKMLLMFKQMFESGSVFPHANEFKSIFEWSKSKSGLDLSKFSYKEIREK